MTGSGTYDEPDECVPEPEGTYDEPDECVPEPEGTYDEPEPIETNPYAGLIDHSGGTN